MKKLIYCVCIPVLSFYFCKYALTIGKKAQTNLTTLKTFENRPALLNAHISLEDAFHLVPEKFDYPYLKEAIQSVASNETIPTLNEQVRMKQTRFESHYLARTKKHAQNKKHHLDLSTSHCAMQIMGETARTMNVSIDDLLIPYTCVETGTTYYVRQLETCMQKQQINLKTAPKNAHTLRKYVDALACAAAKYNGTGERAEKYKYKFLEKFLRSVPDLKKIYYTKRKKENEHENKNEHHANNKRTTSTSKVLYAQNESEAIRK